MSHRLDKPFSPPPTAPVPGGAGPGTWPQRSPWEGSVCIILCGHQKGGLGLKYKVRRADQGQGEGAESMGDTDPQAEDRRVWE